MKVWVLYDSSRGEVVGVYVEERIAREVAEAEMMAEEYVEITEHDLVVA